MNLISQILLRCEFDQSDFDTPWIWSVRLCYSMKLICQILIHSEFEQSDFVTLHRWYFLFCSVRFWTQLNEFTVKISNSLYNNKWNKWNILSASLIIGVESLVSENNSPNYFTKSPFYLLNIIHMWPYTNCWSCWFPFLSATSHSSLMVRR